MAERADKRATDDDMVEHDGCLMLETNNLYYVGVNNVTYVCRVNKLLKDVLCVCVCVREREREREKAIGV